MDVFVAFFSRYMMRSEVNGDLNERGLAVPEKIG